MKKVVLFIIAILIIVLSTANKASAIGVAFSTKAYWSYTPEPGGCLPRDKGFCFHISLNIDAEQINGEMTNSGGLVLTIPRKAISKEDYQYMFMNGQFYLEGEATFSPDLLKALNLPMGFVIKAGTYKTESSGDMYRISFK